MTLDCFLMPRSIAVVGADDDPHAYGGRPIARLLRSGYGGTIYPIASGHGEIQGLRAYDRLSALPEVPDLALLAVPDRNLAGMVDDCAALGVRGGLVVATGQGDLPRELHAEICSRMIAASARGTRFIGPNAQGLANFGTGAVVSPWDISDGESPQDGPVALVSQSGALCNEIYGRLRRRGLGVKYVQGVGAGPVVGAGEMAEGLLTDPGVKVVLLYLEDMRGNLAIERAARAAIERDVPVIALVGGRSDIGQLAATSHTGSLATESRIVSTFLERCGILNVSSVAELVDVADMWATGTAPTGSRTAIISNSGAGCVLAADSAADAGLTVPRFGSATVDAVDALLGASSMCSNPVDIMGLTSSKQDLLEDLLPMVGGDPDVDAVLVSFPVISGAGSAGSFAGQLKAGTERTGVPVVVATPNPRDVLCFRSAGLVVYDDISAAAGALASVGSHRAKMHAARLQVPIVRLPTRTGGRSINEAESLDVLRAFGIPVVDHQLCKSADGAADAFDRLGGSVAVKGCSADVPHKSDLGLVALNLNDRHAVAEAASGHLTRMLDLGVAADGVLIAQMAEGSHEMMVGAHFDPTFGPIVVVGAGGKYVEAVPDVQLLLPPFDVQAAVTAIRRLRCAPILEGVRGEAPADIEAVAEVVVAMGTCILDPMSAVVSIDANPVLVGPRALAGKASVTVADASAIVDAASLNS